MRKIVFVVLILCNVAAWGQLATFDAMSYAVATSQLYQLYEQVQAARGQLEYAYQTYQNMKKQIERFNPKDYWEMMDSLNSIAGNYVSLKSQYKSFHFKVGDNRLYIKDFAQAPGVVEEHFDRIMSGDYTTAEENQAYRFFGVSRDLRTMTKDLSNATNWFIRKAINNATIEDPESREGETLEKSPTVRQYELADQSMVEESQQKQMAILSQQIATMSMEISELKRILAEQQGLLATQAQGQLVDGMKIDVAEKDKARRQYMFSESFITGEDE